MANSVKGHGNKIEVNHAGGYSTSYSHLYKILVSNNQETQKGEVIGLVGNTGRSTAPHLHFELRLNGKFIDPGEKLDISLYSTR